MKKLLINAFMVFLVLFLTSCVTTKQTNLLQEPGGGIPEYSTFIPAGEYKVKVGDQLNIAIHTNPFDNQTSQLFSFMSGSASSSGGSSTKGFAVAPDGTIKFPYIGDISVRGKTTLEIQQLIEKRINENITEDCIVLVSLESKYFSVIGESGSGRYQIAKEQTTIFQALAQSGDVNTYGDRAHIKIIRQIEDGTVIKTFDLRSKDVVNSEFYYIQPDDVIYIQPMGRQFLGLNSFGAVFAVVSTFISLGLMVYNFVK